MLENFIWFYGNHEMLFFTCIILLFFLVFILSSIYIDDFDLSIFSIVIELILLCIFLVVHIDIIMPKYDEIEKKRYPCKYPIDIKYHYKYEDLNGNIHTFISDGYSCDKNYHSNNLTCYYNNTHVQVVSYSYEEEYIYANGCDKE